MQPEERFDRRWGLLGLTLAVACGETDVRVPPPTDYEQGPSPSTKPDPIAACDEAPNGTPCGDPGKAMHCLFDACVRNACGDGIRAGNEECDDGDELDGNGCSARCRREECGNGVIDVGEECDDGNADTLDHCNGCRKQMAMDAGTGQVTAPSASCPASATLIAQPAMAMHGEAITFTGPTSPGAAYWWSVFPEPTPAVQMPGPILDSAFAAGAAKVACGAMLRSDETLSTVVLAGSTAVPNLTLSGTITAKRLVTKPGCSPFLEEITAVCIDGDAGIDAGADPFDAGGETDSGMDASAPLDGGSQEASVPDAGRDAGSLDYDACVGCMRTNCADFNTIPLSGVCFDNLAEGLLGPIPQPNATQRCSDAVQCSIAAASGCAGDVEGPARCYCGDQTLGQCQSTGPLPSAPCIGPWERVTECDTITTAAQRNTCVLDKFQALDLPAGYAKFTIECANALCSASCGLPQPQ